MARTHARILTSIWADGSDFLLLTVEQQWTFFALLSQRNLSTCGVLTYQPKRLVRLAPGLTPARIRKAVDALHAAGYILIDPETDELAFRTFLRNDGILRSPNLLKGAARSYEGIYSPTIRRVVLDQLPTDIQTLWPTAILTTDPRAISAILSRTAEPNVPPHPSDDGSANLPPNDRSTSLIPDPYPLTPSPAPGGQGSPRNGVAPEPDTPNSTAGPADAEPQPHKPIPPPQAIRNTLDGPDGWGNPEATTPNETTDGKLRRRALALRWRDVLEHHGITATPAACNHVIAPLLGDVDTRIVDEQIGWFLEAETPPRSPAALAGAIRRATR